MRFYTGVPDAADNARWAAFWGNKLAALRRQGVRVFARSLRYQTETIAVPECEACGASQAALVRRRSREKGIDVRLALEVVGLAFEQAYDVAVVFSQDQDLSEVADELRQIARQQARWIKIASAYPDGPGLTRDQRRGVYNTDWLPFDRACYEACVDPMDYR